VVLEDAFEKVFENIEDEEDWDGMPLKFRPHLFNALKRVRSKLEAEVEERLVLIPNPMRRQRARDFDPSTLENTTEYIFPVKYCCRHRGPSV
jgi:hypothetical protein